MKFLRKKNPSRWEQDIYIGWVPWSFARWWAACKTWLLIALFGGGAVMFFLEGVTGVFGLIVAIGIFTGYVLVKNRNRGIGLSRSGEIVVFGPHKTLALPIESLRSIGVLNSSKLTGAHLRDPQGTVSRSSWIGKFWEMAGYQGEREEYEAMMTTVATQETQMNSGRGKVFVIRDLEGEFWPISPATGFEVATLRDLALAAKIAFFTPNNPFNVSLRASAEEVVPFIVKGKNGSRSGKKMKGGRRSSQQNKALQSNVLNAPAFEELGGKQAWSPFRKYAFINCNASDKDGPHEVRIREEGLLVPDVATKKSVSVNLGVKMAVALAGLMVLLFVGPLVFMFQNPTLANGFLTRSWTPAFERIWVAPDGWELQENSQTRRAEYSGVVDVAVFTADGDQKVEVWAGSAPSQQDSCADVLYYGGVLREGSELVPEFKLAEGRLYADVSDSVSYWCQQQLDKGQDLPNTVLYRFENTKDQLSFVTGMKTRVNL